MGSRPDEVEFVQSHVVPMVSCASLLVLLVAASAPLHAAARTQWPGLRPGGAASRPWPPGTPDLPADPALRFGRLENGVRFVWLHHPQPAGRCSLRLVVHAGSLDERDDECGMAHFVEHMAFNGTRRFPGNSIDDWFRSQGMQRDLHANARTSLVDTTYAIDLPNNAAATLADGLDVLRQFADAVLFDPVEVDAERGVVDAEERERSSPRARARDALRLRLIAGSRSASRNPIGTAVGRARFTASSLRTFHERWYRADNMTLVLVGDLEARNVQDLCRDAFGSLPKPATALPPRADAGSPTLTDTVFAVEDPDCDDVEFLVQCPVPRRQRPDTVDSLRRRDLRLAAGSLASAMLKGTLGKNPAILGIGASGHGTFDEFESIVVFFRCRPEHARPALAACAKVVQRLCDQGFPDQWLGSARTLALAELDRALDDARNATSTAAADRLAQKLAAHEVPCAPGFERELRRAAWNALTAAACSDEFRAAWAGDPSITSIGPPGHGFDARAVWSEAVKESSSTTDAGRSAASSRPSRNPPTWPYAATAGEGPAPVHRSHDPALDLEDVRFANGVRLLLRPSRQTHDQILVSANVGSGYAHLTEAERHAVFLFEQMQPQSGFGRMSVDEFLQLAAGRRAGVKLRVQPDRYELRGTTNREGLAFQLEWLLAECSDPDIDRDVLDRVTKAAALKIESIQRSSASALQSLVGRLAGQALGFSPDRLEAVGVDEIRSLFAARVRTAPITLVLVGDLDLESTIDLAARTFGRLPERHLPQGQPAAIPYRPITTALREEGDMRSTESSSRVDVFVPLEESEYLDLPPALQLLGRILADRLRIRVREEMGAAYDPTVTSIGLATAPFRCGALCMSVKAEPGKEADALAAVLRVVENIREKGVSPTDLDAARRQAINLWREDRDTNEYWLDALAALHSRTEPLADLATLDRALAGVTAEDVAELARRILAARQLSTLVLRARAAK